MARKLALAAFIISALLACSGDEQRYKIGISQCSEDIWREKQNAELRMGAYFHRNVQLCFAAAYDSDQRQVQQIDSLGATCIDLLIVEPNQVATISPAIDRAYDKGIPVIVFERKTNSQKYTAYMGADNYEMGRVMGDYIAARLKGKGRVLEVMGLKGSSPAIERHKGFADALAKYPQIEVAATLQGDWTEQSARQAIANYKGSPASIDFVFGQNDRMAVGVRKAWAEKGLLAPNTAFCGIDGLPGDDGGIRLVRDSVLDATYIYPTRGDLLLQMAVNILEGKPYDKEVRLMSALVTRDNANVLLMQNDEIVRQSKYVDQLHEQADNYLQQLDTQRIVSALFIALVALLLIVAAILYRYHKQRLRLQEERGRMEREQLNFYTRAAHELRTPLTLVEGPLEQLAQTPAMRHADGKAAEMFAIIRRNTANLSQWVNKILDMQAGASHTGHLSSQQVDEMTVAQTAGQTTTSASHTENVMDNGALQEKDSAAAHDIDEGAPTLLIVDDNADIRAYLRTILQAKYRLLEAEDGQRGLAVAHEQVPDLIVSDVMMPVMNGLDFCQHIKADMLTSHIPVILLTARALSQHQIEGYESGADAYITKPFAPELLTARIANLLQSRQLLKVFWSSKADEAFEEPTVDGEGSGATDEALGETTLAPARPQAGSLPPSAGREHEFIARFRKVVEERLADSDLSVEDIGSQLGLSRVQLYRKVKAITGTTPVDLLRKARLAKAHTLLADTSLTVSEIAYQVGFTSPSYFTKCFKDEYGKVPGEARDRTHS